MVTGCGRLWSVFVKYSIKFPATLHDHVTGKVEPGKRPGPPTVLTAAEETMLCEWLLDMSRIGYGRTTEKLKLVVKKKFLDKDGRPNPFRDNTPGYDWFTAFMKQHPELSIRQSESLPVSRAKGCSKVELDRWFADFYDFLVEHGLLNKPECKWNTDESGIPLRYATGQVLAPRGARSVYSINNNNRQQITTLVAVNAAGQWIPPMHVYPPWGTFPDESIGGWGSWGIHGPVCNRVDDS